MFDDVKAATDALLRCCTNSGKPIAQSEVYNETWLLRMVLAKLYDTVDAFNGKYAEILGHLQKAVRIRWISEGGLRPTLEKEGTTWTDAILGNVALKNDSKVEKDSGSKRGVEIVHYNNDVGVIVVEAKVGSRLASRTSNYDDYDQVARNIACLAQLVMDGKDKDMAGCRFIVICPKPDPIRSSEYNDKVFESMNRNWNDAFKKVGDYDKLGESFTKIKKYHKGKLLEISEVISKRSVVISWEAIIDSLKDSDLKNFYDGVLKENGLYKRENPRPPVKL